MVEAPPVQAGEVIAGKFLVEEVLGAGGMGVVVAATHQELNHRVAIKFLLESATSDSETVERFLREARAAVQIQSEHVAKVMDVGRLDTGAPYMVMEYLDGVDLSEELEWRGRLEPVEAVGYMLQAMEALAEAHALHIVHRDLKPANLFLTNRKDGSRSIKVLDFGISKASEEGDVNLTQDATILGSPFYMAPEQVRDAKSVDPRADIWSIGIILYQCLTGKVPFAGDTLSGVLASIVADSPPSLAGQRSELPQQLVDTVAACLEKDRERRIQNVSELAMRLLDCYPEAGYISGERIYALLGRPSRQVEGLAETAHTHGAPLAGVLRARKAGAAEGKATLSRFPQEAWGVLAESTLRLFSKPRWAFWGSAAGVLLLSGGIFWRTSLEIAAKSEKESRLEESEPAPVRVPGLADPASSGLLQADLAPLPGEEATEPEAIAARQAAPVVVEASVPPASASPSRSPTTPSHRRTTRKARSAPAVAPVSPPVGSDPPAASPALQTAASAPSVPAEPSPPPAAVDPLAGRH